MKQRTKYIATFLLGSLGGSMLGIVVACVAIYVIAMAGMSHQPDQQAMRASQQMSQWSQADVDNLWIEGKAVWDRYKDTSAHVATDDAPTLLRDNEWKIRASPNGLWGFCGGSSFGIDGASISITYLAPTPAEDGTGMTADPYPIGITCRGGSVEGTYDPGTKMWNVHGEPYQPARS